MALLLLGCSASSPADPVTVPTDGVAATRVREITMQQGWSYARNFSGSGVAAANAGHVDVNDAELDPNAMTWQNTGGYLMILPDWKYDTIAFLAYGDGNGDGDPNAGTFDVNVYLVDSYSSWDHVCDFNCTVGELEATHNPVTGVAFNSGSLDPNESYKYAEGEFGSQTSYNWLSTPEYTGDPNTIGRCTLDPWGARVLIVRVNNMSKVSWVMPIVKGRN